MSAGRPVAPWVRLALGAALVVAAVAPRVGPALVGYQASNDAAEHLLIARSLARGEGFTLPIRVRDVDGGPAVHDAYGERAPLFPWLLSVPVRAGVGASGWPDPRLQLVGVALAALCAPLAASVGWALARRRGLRGWRAGWAAAGAGLVVAWAPSLVRASVHLWAEPLGLLLVLVAVRLELALGDERGRSRLRPYEEERARAEERAREEERARPLGVGARHAAPLQDARLAIAIAIGLVGGLARFARPEAWVLVPLLVVGAVWRARRGSGRWGEVVALVGALALVNVVGVAITGVVAPQLFLLEVRRFEEAMGAGAAPGTPSVGGVVAAVASNLGGQVWFLIQPRNAWFVLPLAALAFVPRRRGPGGQAQEEGAACRAATPGVPATAGRGAQTAERWVAVWALAFVLATAGVWSTSDPYRFTIAPLALLAPVALVEGVAWSRALWPGRRWPLAVVVGSLVAILGHAAGRELRGRGPLPAPEVVAREGVVATADPWSYALITGRPAVLARGGVAPGR